jgi:HEPN domain-containing protein
MMQPEKEALRWLTHAKDEFLDADDLRRRSRFYLALFHFQQAAEKALKAFMYAEIESVEVFYTHSVEELASMAREIDPDFGSISRAKKLDQYYIPTRYPNSLPGGVPSRSFDDPDQAEEAMNLAKAVISLVEAKLSQG